MNTNLNYLIKGENLKALKSLLPIYKGKVKLIYIDPPYNTGNDGFKYNDNFNHSTWLTFMKNRLEVAKELLANDGVIFVQIDDNEQAYLKVLMDEIFGRENRNSVICVKVSSESGVKVNVNKPVRVKEYLLVYQKNNQYCYQKQYIENAKFDSNYSYFIKKKHDDPNQWEILNIKKAYYDIYSVQPSDESLYQFQLKYKNSIFSVRNISDSLKVKFGNDSNQFIIIEKENKKTILWKKGEVVFFENKVNVLYNKECATKYLSDIWNNISWHGIANEGGVRLKKGKKPEALLQRIIDMATKEGDLVLDFFAGSGTTGAVAHKMNRRWIMIEQMDYIETIAKVRMQKVINGEQGGVSKNHKWQGGGSFECLNYDL